MFDLGNEATFVSKKQTTIFFKVLESGPIDSARVRRLAGKLRRARVKIFIAAFCNFLISRNPDRFPEIRLGTLIIYWILPTLGGNIFKSFCFRRICGKFFSRICQIINIYRYSKKQKFRNLKYLNYRKHNLIKFTN